MADTSRDATGSAASDWVEPANDARVEVSEFQLVLGRPAVARSLSDIDDPLEGCDSSVRTITYGRVGDPAGTHTRERNQAVTMRAFGYIPTWPKDWIGSASWERPDGDEVGQEIDE